MNISVYIPCYNQEKYIKSTVESVLNQTVKPFEILIIDDCSTDSSPDIIEQLRQENPELIRVIRNQENLGITGTRNVALKSFQGDYVTYLDGDDLYLPNKLEVQKSLIEEYGCDVAVGNYFIFKESPEKPERIWCDDLSRLPDSSIMFESVVGRQFPRNNLFREELVSREIIEAIGLYDVNVKIYEDFDYKIRMSKIASYAFSILPISLYRIHQEGLSKKNVDVHLDTLSYIFEKHKADIQASPDTRTLQAQIDAYLAKVVRNKTGKSQESKLKRKLKRIFG